MQILYVEQPHEFQVGLGESFAKLGGQTVRQRSDDLFSIGRPVFAALFLLDDAPADLEVRVDLNQVHAARHGAVRPDD